MIFLKFMLTEESFAVVSDLLDRTLRDIKSNVEKSNVSPYHSYIATFNLEKLVGFRWRSLLRDVTTEKRKIVTLDAFNSLIDSKQTKTNSVSRPLDRCNSNVKSSNVHSGC